MNQVIFNIKKELKNLIIIFIILFIIFKIIFIKETIYNSLKIYAGFWWVFIIPGFLIMCYWHDKLEFVERFFLGIGVSLAFTGIFSYYIGLIGINTKYHGIFLPIMQILIGLFIIFIKLRKKE